MTNCTFLWDNKWDIASLTPSTENPLFPAINTQHRWHTRTWRSINNTGTLTESIVADFGASPPAIQAFAIKKHNFSPSAVVSIQADDDPAFGSLDIDVEVPVAELMAYFWLAPQTPYQYWRVLIVDIAPVAAYLEIGRIFLGPYLSPSINMSIDYKKSTEDPSDVMFSSGGQIVTNQKTRYRTMDMKFENLPSVDADLFDAMFIDRGVGREFFFTRDRDLPSTTTMYVRFGSKPTIDHVFGENYFNVSCALEELR
jgi:hypothetical protein